MSTPAPPLFATLFDDAAVFPPGNAPLVDAIARRLDRAGRDDETYVGPLLVPPRLVAEALSATHPLPIVVVGRPGTPCDEILDAAKTVAAHQLHSLSGIQLGHAPGWEAALELAVPVSVELAAGDLTPLAALAVHRGSVAGKLRTGATPDIPVPSPEQLAAFIAASLAGGLRFRLTGGLHFAVSHGDGEGREFGFLNVIAATAALQDGTDPHDAAALLDERSEAIVVERIRSITDPVRVRSAFASYGCCEVTDPIAEIRRLHLDTVEGTT
ncbi:hypothetical protein G9U51_01730 [Calidifontibacter sp. DB0510]|uniref:Uncharacterized protein n=1 Tax=Metallococcus carri TaxID=1656884 RepID=A0A967AZ58_9MICO|nr:hypothetical protein [Metallococcus carri]NHN54500.1 hypothetical protein [Metallococcus carri]NOP36661.1 hypothetical protein [Calidifontibacter sp. DB2511S]